MFYRVTYVKEMYVEADCEEEAKERALNGIVFCTNRHIDNVEPVSEIIFNTEPS